MDTEYKIICTPLEGAELSAVMHQFPSPISRPEMREIYNYRIDMDGYYLVDRGINGRVTAVALKLLVDAALTQHPTVKIRRL